VICIGLHRHVAAERATGYWSTGPLDDRQRVISPQTGDGYRAPEMREALRSAWVIEMLGRAPSGFSRPT